MAEEIRAERLKASTTIVLPVPLVGQRFRLECWREDGFASPCDSASWSNRSCGIACVRMVILHHAGTAPGMAHLLWQGLKIDAHCDKGWIHEGLAKLLRYHDISARAVDIGSNILSSVDAIRSNRLLIASVADKLPCDGRLGGHLIVVRGFELDGSGRLARIYFNDPSTWGQVNHSSSIDRFLCSFSGRVIIS